MLSGLSKERLGGVEAAHEVIGFCREDFDEFVEDAALEDEAL